MRIKAALVERADCVETQSASTVAKPPATKLRGKRLDEYRFPRRSVEIHSTVLSVRTAYRIRCEFGTTVRRATTSAGPSTRMLSVGTPSKPLTRIHDACVGPLARASRRESPPAQTAAAPPVPKYVGAQPSVEIKNEPKPPLIDPIRSTFRLSGLTSSAYAAVAPRAAAAMILEQYP